MDMSGSMCTAYSTMGSLQKSEDFNQILLIIWMQYNMRVRRTPIIKHENVVGFASEKLVEEAYKHGYSHVQISCKPMHVNCYVGRTRK